MSIKYVILGFLSETPLTGYDLKKRFSESEIFHWSGNNNQIYRTLVDLHAEKLVTIEVQYQESKPPRKIYTLTEAGRMALHDWLLTPPELPQFRNNLVMQLTWADQLEPRTLDRLLATYADELYEHLLVLRERARRSESGGTFRERIAAHWIAFYQLELDWVYELRQSIPPE